MWCVYIYIDTYIRVQQLFFCTVDSLNSCEGNQSVYTLLHRHRVNLLALCLFQLGRSHKKIPLRFAQVSSAIESTVPVPDQRKHGEQTPSQMLHFSRAWEEQALTPRQQKGPQEQPQNACSPWVIRAHVACRVWWELGYFHKQSETSLYGSCRGSLLSGIVMWQRSEVVKQQKFSLFLGSLFQF